MNLPPLVWRRSAGRRHPREILIGEQVVPVAKRWLGGDRITAAWTKTECTPHVFGELPKRASHSRVMENKT
jgi:xanthosine utilization system XapX-like protein